jgi:hypothetical protein
MGEVVRGIYRARKQRASGPKGRMPGTITQWFKGCLIRLGLIQRLIQKVEDVRYF